MKPPALPRCRGLLGVSISCMADDRDRCPHTAEYIAVHLRFDGWTAACTKCPNSERWTSDGEAPLHVQEAVALTRLITGR